MLKNHIANDNQQPSIDRNINEGSTTNSRNLTSNVEVSNANTSALPNIIGDDIVWTTRIIAINNEWVEYKDKEPYR